MSFITTGGIHVAMTTAILIFGTSALAVALAGTMLTRFADAISEATSLGRTVTGFLLVAGATSLPELVVDCNAARIAAPDIVVGDLMGSCLFNLLILGIIDLVHKSEHRMLSSVSAAHALSSITSIVLTSIACLFVIMPSQMTFMRIGIGPIAIGVIYLLALRMIFTGLRQQHQHVATTRANRLLGPAVGYLLSALIILVAGRFVATSSHTLASLSGLGDSFVGTSLVALTTSLPEIATTVAAVRIGAFDMAVGNVFGSNCFNLAILWVVDAFYVPGPILQAVEPTHAITGISIVIITGLATMGLLYRVEKKYWLIEPDALLIVLLTLGALFIAYLNGAA